MSKNIGVFEINCPLDMNQKIAHYHDKIGDFVNEKLNKKSENSE